jgi:hypothetical protein
VDCIGTFTTEQIKNSSLLMYARTSISPHHVVKLLRAYGGCLGARSRRRAWYTAISLGEPCAGVISGDTRMGKPTWAIPRYPPLNT